MDTKPWYQSKGIWAGIVTTLIGCYVVVRINFPNLGLPAPDSGILGTIISLLGALGIYSRATLTTTIAK